MISILEQDSAKENRDDGNTLNNLFLTNQEWFILDELIELLDNFAVATEALGGSNYPTLGMMYPIINSLFEHVKNNNK